MQAVARSIFAARRSPPVTRATAWMRRISPVYALVALIAISIAVRAVLALRDPSPWLFQDEVLYSELAQSLAGGSFSIRGAPGSSGFGLIYPLLIAPAYWVFSDTSTAYAAAKLINVGLMSLVAVPVYLMARALVSARLALVAATLALAIPAFTFTSQLLTENAFFVIFMTTILVMMRAVERPTLVRQLGVLALIAVAYLTRAQGLALVPTLLAAVLLDASLRARTARSARFRAFASGLKAFSIIWLVLAVAAGGWLALQLARGESLRTRLLGAYAPLEEVDYSVLGVARWTIYHLAELDFSLGIIPFAAFLVVCVDTLRRHEVPAPMRAFVVVALPAVAALTLVVAAFASSPFSRQIEERNLFYIVPLFLVALVVWVSRGPYRSPLVAACAVAAAALPLSTPLTAFTNARGVSETMSLLSLRGLVDRGVAIEDIPLAVALGALAGGVSIAVASRGYVRFAPFVVLVFFAVMAAPVERVTHRASFDAGAAGIRAGDKDWIDEAVGSDADVATIYTGLAGFHVLWVNEILNRSVGPLYNMPGQLPDGLPQTPVVLETESGRVLHAEDGAEVKHTYVLVDRTLGVAGDVVARDEGTGMSVYETGGLIRLESQITGLFPDTWSGATVSYTRFACQGGKVTIRVTSDPNLHRQPQVVTATVAGEPVATYQIPVGGIDIPLEAELPSDGSACGVNFEVSPTASPNAVYGSPDARELGVRFVDVEYTPPA